MKEEEIKEKAIEKAEEILKILGKMPCEDKVLDYDKKNEEAYHDIVKIARSVGMEITNETAISTMFCVEVMRRLEKTHSQERETLRCHIRSLEERILQIESEQEREKKKIFKRLIAYLKRPKCKNEYYCADCIHSDAHWEGLRFRGFSCRINAR